MRNFINSVSLINGRRLNPRTLGNFNLRFNSLNYFLSFAVFFLWAGFLPGRSAYNTEMPDKVCPNISTIKGCDGVRHSDNSGIAFDYNKPCDVKYLSVFYCSAGHDIRFTLYPGTGADGEANLNAYFYRNNNSPCDKRTKQIDCNFNVISGVRYITARVPAGITTSGNIHASVRLCAATGLRPCND